MNSMSNSPELKIWKIRECAVFHKVKEDFGGLSNMSNEYCLEVGGTEVRTSEALYQALKFPHLPGVQRTILNEASPMSAKMKAKPHAREIRGDWEQVKVEVMRWCLRVKLVLHTTRFGRILLSTGDRDIVERSHKDRFWGAVPGEPGVLVGGNQLGGLLVELRSDLQDRGVEGMMEVLTPEFAGALLLEKPIGMVRRRTFIR